MAIFCINQEYLIILVKNFIYCAYIIIDWGDTESENWRHQQLDRKPLPHW